MSDQLMFVQFPHPGSEHVAVGPEMAWNRGVHARKFLKAQGRYLLDGKFGEGPISFWGEWEPQSWIVETYAPGPSVWPRALHEPYWQVPSDRHSLQNTDPLVFGDRFLYSNCRQLRNAKLRALAQGSIILFGSKVGGQFVLDTLFVVGERGRPYTRGSSASLETDSWVQDVLFRPLQESARSQDDEFRLYRARMQSEAPDGLFSFVPCLPYLPGRSAFARPVIELDERWISPKLAMGAKATPGSAQELHMLWDQIVHQVIDSAGLALGIELTVPQRLPS